MKRMILCNKCAGPPDYKNSSPTGENYPGELEDLRMGLWVIRKRGKARGHYGCDLCGTDITTGTPCVAESSGYKRHPYFEWESDFLEEMEK